jgi:endoglucanase
MNQVSFRYLAGFILAGFGLFAQNPADQIRLNQVGFYPNAPKQALVVGKNYENFKLIDQQTKKLYLAENKRGD